MELLALAMFGNFWFWTYSLGLLIGLIWLVEFTEDGSPGSSFGAFFVYSGMLWWQFDIPIGGVLSYLGDNPLTTIMLMLGYFGIGTAYGTWKWVRVMKKAAKKLRALKAAFMEKNNIQGDTIPEEAKKAWRNHRESVYYHRDPAPKALNNKSRIISWMAYWPFSLMWSLTADFLVDAWNWCFEFITTFLNNMWKRHFKDLQDAID